MLEEALIEAGCTIETRKLIDFLLSDEKPIENPKVLENDESEHSEDNYEEQVSEEFNADTSDEDFEYLRVNKKHKTVKSRNAPRKWTEDENKVISQLVKKYPGNYKKIASILKNRKPEECCIKIMLSVYLTYFSSTLESCIKTIYKERKIFYRRRIGAN